MAEANGLNAQILITAVAGFFILPFFLFSATAGQIADKYEKTFLIHIIKTVEVVIMLFTSVAFYYMHLWSLVVLLFLMGVHSTFFGPLKFSILPQHLKENELVAGNGFVSAGTYIAILTGTLCGGLFILKDLGRIYISFGIVGVALLGLTASFFIPKAPPTAPDTKVDINIPRATWNILSYIMPNKVVFRSILGISWFWFLGAVFLSQFPTFAKDILGGNEEVSTFFLIVFSVGVGLGSTMCNKLLGGKVSARLVPYACLGISVAILVLFFSSIMFAKSSELVGFLGFMANPMSWGITAGLLMLAASGGMYSVPMYAVMQAKSDTGHRARTVACLNILDSFGMVMSAVFISVMLAFGVSITNIFLIMGVLNLAMTPLLRKLAGAENVK